MARAGINWARGLDELGTGLLRQVDIGGKAYEGAMAAEAETRAENRALRAEKRRSAEWDRQQLALEGTTKRAELRGDVRFTQRLKEEGVARVELLEQELDMRFEGWKKEYALKQKDVKAAAEDKARINALEKRYEKAQKTYEVLVKEFGADPTGPGFKYAYRAQQDAIQAWQDFSVASGLKMQPNPEIDRLRIKTIEAVYAEIVSRDLQRDEPFKDFVKALELGYGPGKEGGKDLDDAMKTINDAIDRLGISLPDKEKSEMLDGLVKVFLANPNLRDAGNGELNPDPAEADPAIVTPTPTTEGITNVQEGLREQLSTIESQLPELKNQYKSISEQRAKEKAAYNHSEILRRILESGMPADKVQSAYETNPDLFKDGNGDTISLDRVMRIWATNEEYSALQIKIRDLESRAGAIKIEIQKYGNLGAIPQASRNIMGSENMGMIAAVDQGISPQELAYWEPDVADARARATQQQRTA